MLLIWILTSALSGVMSEAVDDPDYEDQCMPALADRCFKGVMASLECKLKMASPQSCVGVPEVCSVWEESLNCAADIVDTDCKAEEGLVNFDIWLTGLRSVQARVCNPKYDLLKDLAKMPCFNLDEFVECLDDLTKVTHVVDLLHVNLNITECNRILIAFPTCNVRASPGHSVCYASEEIINDIIHTFFSHSPCGNTCPIFSNTSILSSYEELILIFQALLIVLLN